MRVSGSQFQKTQLHIKNISESPTKAFQTTQAISIPVLHLKTFPQDSEISHGWDSLPAGTTSTHVRISWPSGLQDGKN